jgi:hypothetical protein
VMISVSCISCNIKYYIKSEFKGVIGLTNYTLYSYNTLYYILYIYLLYNVSIIREYRGI